MRKSTRTLGAVALATAVVTGGTAFTASNTMEATATKGYGSQTISGVAVDSVTYNTNSTGATITSVGLVLTGDTTTKDIRIAFTDAAPKLCSDIAGAKVSGVHDPVDDKTTYECVVDVAVADQTKFALVATNINDPDYAVS